MKRLNRLIALILLLALIPAQFLVSAATSELFFSEYIEGSGYNKVVEIYNGTGGAIDLSAYTLELYSNGAATPTASTSLSGTLADGDVYVIAHGHIEVAAEIKDAADDFNCGNFSFGGGDWADECHVNNGG